MAAPANNAAANNGDDVFLIGVVRQDDASHAIDISQNDVVDVDDAADGQPAGDNKPLDAVQPEEPAAAYERRSREQLARRDRRYERALRKSRRRQDDWTKNWIRYRLQQIFEKAKIGDVAAIDEQRNLLLMLDMQWEE